LEYGVLRGALSGGMLLNFLAPFKNRFAPDVGWTKPAINRNDGLSYHQPERAQQIVVEIFPLSSLEADVCQHRRIVIVIVL